MRTVLLLAVLLPSSAFAWDSSREDVLFKVEGAELYKGSGFTYRFPSGESSIWLELSADTDASLDVSLLGDAKLEGEGTTLEHTWMPVVEGGLAKLISETTLSATANVNFWDGAFVWSGSLWSDRFTYTGEKVFDSLLLTGGGSSLMATIAAATTDLFEVEQPIVIISDDDGDGDDEFYFNLTLSAQPRSTVQLSGLSISTNGTEGTSQNTAYEIETPDENDGELPMTAYWRGKAAASFDLGITLEIKGCYDGLGCISTNDILTYPWHVQDGEATIVAPAEPFEHDLPAIDVQATTINIGTVTIGDLESKDITIADLGLIDLEGTIEVEGDGFTIDHDEFDASKDDDAKITLTFEPLEAGSVTGELVFHSNDPVFPEVRVPIRGEGVEVEEEDSGDTEDDTDIGSDTDGSDDKKCGCSTQSTSPMSLAFVSIGLGALLVRRRR